MRYVEESGWSVTVLGAASDWLAVHEGSGLRSVYLGDEAVVDCARWTSCVATPIWISRTASWTSW
jgi:lysyl-tRNA synthetase, class II